MFSEACVKNSVHGGVSARHSPPSRQTRQTPPWADNPHWADTPLDKLGRHPQADTPPGRHPPPQAVIPSLD